MKLDRKELVGLLNTDFNDWIGRRSSQNVIGEINVIGLLRDELGKFQQDSKNDPVLIGLISRFLETVPERKEFCELMSNTLQQIYKWEVDADKRQETNYEQWLEGKLKANDEQGLCYELVGDDEGYDTEPYVDEDKEEVRQSGLRL
jgi:hypothetical protein